MFTSRSLILSYVDVMREITGLTSSKTIAVVLKVPKFAQPHLGRESGERRLIVARGEG